MSDELSPSAAARRMGASTRSVQRWIANGTLPARRVGGRWRVASDAIDAFAPGVQRPTGVATGVPSVAIQRLFIANRGEIARRIRRTADRLGIHVIEPVTDGRGSIDLLDVDAVASAAIHAGADAVHPGFGFLAENADFAEAVIGSGMRWVGPPPAAIRLMGDKAAARRLAASLGVPIVPGYDEADQSDGKLARAARRVGFPLLVKPAGGGGGKGMRTARDASALPNALSAGRREAIAAFGDGRLILERLIEGPRHVEVQVLFDGHGRGVHLGERDCSTQRRHQKVLEESPGPAVSPEIRTALTSAALRLANAVRYANAGTLEFLLADGGQIYFLEMNTRLQVEHPVTEAVTGIDLVEHQLRLAAGEPLALRQPDVDAALAQGGHAVEVRVYAEDAEHGFLPAIGRVERLAWPAGEGIRVDAGIDEGTEVGSRFDPMLAKIVAHGRDRREALGRLAAALDGTLILGLTTNLRFLRWLVREPAVIDGEMRVDTLERIWPPDDWPHRARVPETAWHAAAAALGGDRSSAGWSSGWRVNASPRFRLESEAAERTVELATGVGSGPGPALVRQGPFVHVDVGGRSVPFRLASPPDVDAAARAASTHHGAGPAELEAPMPGSILAVHAGPGSAVSAGDPIVTLEAMKMEHVVASPIDGRVAGLSVRGGDQVARGDPLAVIEPER